MFEPVLPIASLSEGDVVQVRVAGQELLVCQVDGGFYAVDARCSHAAQSLAHGRLAGFELKCPLHGASFDIRTGACTRAPATAPIRTFPVILDGGKVCIDV